jgi:hypothetical protein
MTSRPVDTAPAAWSRYEAVLDELDGQGRLRAAVELSEAVRELRLAGIRARSPNLSVAEAVAQVVAEDYGVELPVRP